MAVLAEDEISTDTEIPTIQNPKILKQIDALNDYIIVWLDQAKVGVELPDEIKAKLRNQGLIIGLGPDVNKGLFHDYRGTPDEIKLGDEVVIRANKYNMINPQSGVYAGQEIVLVHKPDMVYRHAQNDGRYVFKIWTADDTRAVQRENL